MVPPHAAGHGVLAALLLAIVACAIDATGRPGSRTPAATIPRGDGSCVTVSSITSFTVLDRNRIVLNAGQPYVIELEPGCPSFSFADETLGFATNDGRICDYRIEEIVTADGRCRILAIRRGGADADSSREIDEAIESENPSSP
jgi:hypothetical protein